MPESKMPIAAMVRLLGNSEFDDLSDKEMDWWIDLCSVFVSKEKFGRIYEKAVALYTCHVLEMQGLGNDSSLGDIGKIAREAGGAGISSISDGGSSISFQNGQSMSASADSDLAQTAYGRQFLALRRALIVPITINH